MWLACLLLAACGARFGHDDGTLAEQAHVNVVGQAPGVTTFIRTLTLGLEHYGDLTSLSFTIAPRPGSYSRPVSVTYDKAWLDRKAVHDTEANRLTVPVFGLYADYRNDVSVTATFSDGSSHTEKVTMETAPYTGPAALYAAPDIKTGRGSLSPGFDYVFIQNGITTPVVIDSDGNLRWAATGLSNSISSMFSGDGFYVGGGSPPVLFRLGLDGSLASVPLASGTLAGFHHDLAPGKNGILAEMDALDNGVQQVETVLAEITPTGQVLRQWDMAAIFRDFMRAHGDDPSNFVRAGVDWFHMNSAIYNPADDSLLVSSRENFVVKLDYASGRIKWLFGDPTKHWYVDYPSLRAVALRLDGGGKYPIGQHSLSVTPDGSLLLFNNGTASLNQPPGTSPGATLAASAPVKYRIDEQAGTASVTWTYEHQPAVVSELCSSVYQAGASNYLVAYSMAGGGVKGKLVGVDSAGNVAFDYEYPTEICSTVFIANPIDFAALKLR
jgi:hypothetical protein